MKKVLLHLAAIFGLALVCAAFMMYWPYVSTSGFVGRWKVSIILSCAYLLALAWFFFAVRGLKKRACKGLWIYSLPPFLLLGLYLYGCFASGYGEVLLSTIKNVPYTVFFLLPPLLIPLMPLSEKGKGTLLAVALFAVLAVAFGGMAIGWYRYEDWNRKSLFDPMDHLNKTFVSDAYTESSDGLLLTVDEEGKMYAYVSYAKLKKDIGYRRQPIEIFSVRREGNEFLFTKDFYTDQTQAEPVLSIPCMRGYIWYDREKAYAYVASMSYEENPLFTQNELGYLYGRLERTDRTDVGAEDPLAGRRPEDWPGVEWDMLDQHFTVGEDHRMTNENGMVLLWTYTDNRFLLAKKQEGPEGVTYEPRACGRKKLGRGIYDIRNMGTGVFWNGTGTFVDTDYDGQDKGVLWPGEPLDQVKEMYLAAGWTEAAVAPECAASLCLLERDSQRLLLFFAVEDDAYSWADWSDEIDPEERLVTGYARFAPDGSLETYGGLIPVAAEQADHLLTLLNTRAKIGSFGYIDWQASWPARTRLTIDGRLILPDKAGEWTSIPLSGIEK